MISQTRLTFKDVIEAKNAYNSSINEERYTYDEYMAIVKGEEGREKKGINFSKKDKLTMDFIDENLTNICNCLNDLIERYNMDGFLNNVKYKDILNVITPNLKVDEIVNEFDENDHSGEDDENNFKE